MKSRNLKLILAILSMVASIPVATATDDHHIWKSGRYGVPPVAQTGTQEKLRPLASSARPDGASSQLKIGETSEPAARSATPKAPGAFAAHPPKPDLMTWAFYPLPAEAGLPLGFPGTTFCVPNPAGGAAAHIRFRVRNMTAGQAAASTAHVNFIGAATVNVPIPAIAGNGETIASAQIPTGCYPPGFSKTCQFNIVLDATKQVEEASEANNGTTSLCVGPAG